MAEGSTSRSHAMPGVRQVTELEADYVTELFTLAFQDDPTWGWAFPDPRNAMSIIVSGGVYTCTARCRTDGFG
jgi:hypothetical protein